MRKEYDLTKLKVKRRGPIKGLHGVPARPILSCNARNCTRREV